MANNQQEDVFANPFAATNNAAAGDTPTVAATGSYIPSMSAGNVVQGYLDGFLNSGSSYVQNARQGAANYAASRGTLNSSMAAGSGQRAAIESVQPLVGQAMGLHGQREQNAFTGEQNFLNNQFTAQQNQAQRQMTIDQAQLDRNHSNEQLTSQQGFQNNQAALDRNYGREQMQWQQQQQQQQLQAQADLAALGRDHDIQMSQIQDWLSSQAFNREFNAQLSLLPLQSMAELNSYIQQAALSDPEAYTPSVVNGLTNFFNTNFFSTLRSFFPDLYGGEQ